MLAIRIRIPAILVLSLAALECPVLKPIESGHQCFGLSVDTAAVDASLCSRNCCQDTYCEAWQFLGGGCWRGRPHYCGYVDNLGEDVPGAWIREKGNWTTNHDFDDIDGQLLNYEGDASLFNVLGCIEPYICGREELELSSPSGEQILARRHGPGIHGIDISVTCWSRQRWSNYCCSGLHECWNEYEGAAEDLRRRCCSLGVDAVEPNSMTNMFNVYTMISSRMSHIELEKWNRVIPSFEIDELAFAQKRSRWRVGQYESKEWCTNDRTVTQHEEARAGGIVNDHPTRLRQLVHSLQAAGVEMSRTFINIGAGTCKPPDPLYQLLHSPDGFGFTGLAVDSNRQDLKECHQTYESCHACVLNLYSAHMVAEPLEIKEMILPHLTNLFGADLSSHSQPLPLDLLVVDIDGVDCLVTEELLEIVQPKILVLEMMFHIPPPFRFSSQYDSVRSQETQDVYDVSRLNPAHGCSLSYAIHTFRGRGYLFSHMTDMDAVFIHQSIASAVEQAFGVQLPQDEFYCYRNSRLWVQMPMRWVREWFFAPHPAQSFGSIWANISQYRKSSGHSGEPFTLDY